MKLPRLFIPHALAQAPIVFESRLVRDLTMKPIDESEYESPSWMRMAKPNPFRQRELPEHLKAA